MKKVGVWGRRMIFLTHFCSLEMGDIRMINRGNKIGKQILGGALKTKLGWERNHMMREVSILLLMTELQS